MNHWFSRFGLWCGRFMSGRHGGDQLSIALLVLYAVLLLCSNIFRFGLLYWLALAALAWCLFRMLSRNNERRWEENNWFMGWWGPVWAWMRGVRGRFRTAQEYAAMKARDRGVYRYFRCPRCGSKLRVPVGKGKIVITCPVCHNSFTKKT